MQMNKAFLRNSEIVIFFKKNNFAAVRVSFFSSPLDRKHFFFFFTLALGALFLSARGGHVSSNYQLKFHANVADFCRPDVVWFACAITYVTYDQSSQSKS